MAFYKFIAAGAEPLSGIFAADHGALFAINGRLSGFFPFPAPGDDPGTPGIATTTLLDGTIQRFITLTLSPPGEPDDLRFPPGGQTTSFAIIDGTVVESDASIQLDLILREPISATLLDQVPIIIYMSLPNTVEDPKFGVARESTIDAGPQKIAKLAFYDPETQTWLPYPAVSLRGIYQRLLDISNRLGGFLVVRDSLVQLHVTPGFIVGQFGRIINPSISIVVPFPPPPLLQRRKDVLFVNDPGAENIPITFTTLLGADKVMTLSDARKEPPSRPTSPSMVALAEIIHDSTGVVEVIDVRPVQAWATDAMQQRDPDATEKIDITSLQPGLAFLDQIPGADETWAIFVMRGKSAVTGIVNKSKLVVGLIGNEVERTFSAPDSGPLSFVPGNNQFPAAPYVVEASFKALSITAGTDVTNDPAYAINFDFLNGKFVPPGITAQTPGEQIQMRYQPLRVLFTFDDNGDVSIPELALIRKHIAANSPYWELPPTNPLNLPFTTLPQNPAAHTGFNIVVDNTAKFMPGGVAVPDAISVQTAIEILATTLPPHPANPLAGKKFSMNWRMAAGSDLFPVAIFFFGTWPTDLPPESETFYHILGPAGEGPSQYQATTGFSSGGGRGDDWPTVLDPKEFGIRFPFPSGKVLGGSVTFLGINGSTNASINGDAEFEVWVGSQNFIPSNLVKFGPLVPSGVIGTHGRFELATPLPIISGDFARLALLGPSGNVGSGIGAKEARVKILSLSMDLFVELT